MALSSFNFAPVPVVLERREAGGCASGRLLEELRGIGRKCAFYNGFVGCFPTVLESDVDGAWLRRHSRMPMPNFAENTFLR